ncbi:hypothetical protein ACFC4S_22705 [Priestia megaterium]
MPEKEREQMMKFIETLEDLIGKKKKQGYTRFTYKSDGTTYI